MFKRISKEAMADKKVTCYNRKSTIYIALEIRYVFIDSYFYAFMTITKTNILLKAIFWAERHGSDKDVLVIVRGVI